MNAKDKKLIENYERDDNGLVKSEDYILNEDGSISWRQMIKPEHLYINKAWFEENNKQAPECAVGLKDHQVLISLAGIKELARLRGFTSLTFPKVISDPHSKYVSAKCRIEWIGNYETGGQAVVYEDCANATAENTGDVYDKFLEAIACNRALVRCVRNFLNIHVVGEDEMDKSDQTKAHSIEPKEKSDNTSIPTPSKTLENVCQENGIKGMDELKEFLREKWEDKTYRNKEVKDWENFGDIPAKDCRIITALVKKG